MRGSGAVPVRGRESGKGGLNAAGSRGDGGAGRVMANVSTFLGLTLAPSLPPPQRLKDDHLPRRTGHRSLNETQTWPRRPSLELRELSFWNREEIGVAARS